MCKFDIITVEHDKLFKWFVGNRAAKLRCLTFSVSLVEDLSGCTLMLDFPSIPG